VLIIITIALVFIMKGSDIFNKTPKMIFSEEMSLKQIAKQNGFPVKEILHILSHDDITSWDLPRNKPLKKTGVNINSIKHALEHI